MYDYLEAMVEDIKDVFDEYDWDTEDREELAEKMNDDLWTDDHVTGNGSASYTFNREKAKEYVLEAGIDYLIEAVNEFGVSKEEIGEKFLDEEWEWMDVTIRCYLLGQAIEQALDELGY